MEKVRKFKQYLELEEIPGLIEMFLEKGEQRIYNRNQFFLREGQRSELMGYIAKGGFRHLIQASDGTDRVAGYSLEGDFIWAFPAFVSDASAVSIQAFKESEVYLLPRKDSYEQQTLDFRFRHSEAALREVYGRLLLMHHSTPEERYLSLIAHYPDILHEVSLKEIASYLRMTPETLSRIRKKILIK